MNWVDVYVKLTASPRRAIVRVPKNQIVHPVTAGARESVGLPVGQRRDYRFPPDQASRGMHAQDFGHEWRVHLDLVHPDVDLAAHLRYDVFNR